MCVCVCVCVFSQKLWYMLLGTEFVFISRIRRVLGGASAPKSFLFSEIYL